MSAISILLVVALLVLAITGVTSGIRALRKPNQNKGLAVVGLLANSLVMVAFLGLIVFVFKDISGVFG